MRGNALCGVSMGKSRLGVMALFGNVKLVRLFCYRCQALALVVGGEFQCCGISTKEEAKIYVACQREIKERKAAKAADLSGMF